MNFETRHPLQPYWNAAAAPLQAQALDQALEHGLFDALAREPARAVEVAQRLALEPRATALWLDLLWSMALLQRHVGQDSAAPRYLASPLARQFFAGQAAQACAQAWRYRADLLAAMAASWPELLRDGVKPQGPAAPRGSWAQAARVQIGQEQTAVTAPAVLRLLQSLPPLPSQGRFLDLGGGPGHVAIALAQALPQWHGEVWDEPETAGVAQENIVRAGLQARLSARGCDLNRDFPGGGYGLIWCSAVLHFLSDPQAALAAMARGLAPGGRLLLAHAEQTDDPALAAQVLPFYGALRLRGNYLPQAGEIAAGMRQAGLQSVECLGRCDFPMAPVWVYAGQRA